MVVMPNHFHCIIENMEIGENVSKMDGYGLDANRDAHGLDANRDAHGFDVDPNAHGLDVNRNAHGLDDNRDTHELDVNRDAHGLDVNRDAHGLDDNRDAHGLDVNRDTHGWDDNRDAHGLDVNRNAHGLDDNRDAHVGAPLRGHPDNHTNPDIHPKYGLHNKKFGAGIGDVMDWFKTMTTNEYIRGVNNHNWQRFEGKLWQRNYYDHIIRDRAAYERISTYIIENAERWDNDKFNGRE